MLLNQIESIYYLSVLTFSLTESQCQQVNLLIYSTKDIYIYIICVGEMHGMYQSFLVTTIKSLVYIHVNCFTLRNVIAFRSMNRIYD